MKKEKGMITQKITIKNKLGLHARPASNFVKMAQSFKSKIEILKGEKRLNAKSMIGILAAGAKCGTEIELAVEGEDEQEAMKQLTEFIDAGLGE